MRISDWSSDCALPISFGDLASAVGSSVSENVFYVNGLNITDFRQGLGSVTVPFEFYETVDVKNGGYPAEFGRATGAFVNATTKSGSNEFHGRSEEHTSELQSLMRISYAVFCLKKKKI